VLIVDEPTAGLDPEERIRFRNLLCDFAEGRIVILSTHIVEDIEFTCENLAVLKEGRLLYSGKAKELMERAGGSVWSVPLNREELEKARKGYTIISTVSEGEYIKARILAPEKPFEKAVPARPCIEDAYMKLVKEA
jgi:ABC-2 type transport system ATP-binding protein